MQQHWALESFKTTWLTSIKSGSGSKVLCGVVLSESKLLSRICTN